MIYKNKKIIVAPLNWGLGHSTRCIPIINFLIQEGFTPIIASDGDALKLLQKEFPKLKSYRLPSYNIKYTRKGTRLKYRLLYDSARIIISVNKEKYIIEKIVEKEEVIGIISDNRFGVRSKNVPSIYITHQINVFSGITTFLTSLLHQKVISKFDSCWIPDYNDESSLAGILSDVNNQNIQLKYIGTLSRFTYQNIPKKWDLLILLSGPEPQRSILEKKLLNELKTYDKKVLFIRGIVSEQEEISESENLRIVNFMLQKDLERSINESKVIISRSGYSTIMDLEKLKAKAFFIPTPGQFEQEYLAKNLEQKKTSPYSTQEDFNISMLEKIKDYKGFTLKPKPNGVDFKTLFKVEFLDYIQSNDLI